MWLLLLWAAVALGGFVQPTRPCPTLVRDDLLVCLSAMDANEDGTLTAAELDTWTAAHAACLPFSFASNYNGASIVAACDTDASGNLTMSDWSAGNACFALRSRQMLLCEWCVKCGV
jgi:hypothetical protein